MTHTAPATATPATIAPAVIGDLAPITWETKSGKARQAHSHMGMALAPRAARLNQAASADVSRLVAGRYGAFLADVRGALSGRALEWVRGDVRTRLAVIIDGQKLAPVNEPLDGAGDKRLMMALVASLEELAAGNAAYAKKDGTVTPIKAPAKCLHFAAVGTAWRDAVQVAEVAKVAGL